MTRTTRVRLFLEGHSILLLAAIIGAGLYLLANSETIPFGAPLGAATVIIGAAIASRRIENAVEFTPFAVGIRIHRSLLADFGLATAAELDALERRCAKMERSAIRDGIRFSLLRVGVLSSSGTLVYWDDYHSFSSNFDLSCPLAELKRYSSRNALADSMLDLERGDDGAPWLYLDYDAEGLALSVRKPGWDEEKKRAALLPWAEFDIGQWRYGKSFLADEQLEKYGWARANNDTDSLRAPYELTHDYFTVTWRYI